MPLTVSTGGGVAMALFGEDFRRARQGWLYDAHNAQPFWFVALAFALLFLVLLLRPQGLLGRAQIQKV